MPKVKNIKKVKKVNKVNKVNKGKNYARCITQKQLDGLDNPTLEDIMAFVNGGGYDKFFRDRPKEFPDGSREFLTKKGGNVYGKLVSILYACARLTDADAEDIVETMDNIISEG